MAWEDGDKQRPVGRLPRNGRFRSAGSKHFQSFLMELGRSTITVPVKSQGMKRKRGSTIPPTSSSSHSRPRPTQCAYHPFLSLFLPFSDRVEWGECQPAWHSWQSDCPRESSGGKEGTAAVGRSDKVALSGANRAGGHSSLLWRIFQWRAFQKTQY